jgi:FkbM family methyltransferase
MLPPDHQEYRLGRTQLALPCGHKLGAFREDWPRLQLPIGDLAAAIETKYPGFCAVDIGANVGDTAAVICSRIDVPVLCVEGNPAFWPYLEENARRIGRQIELECALIGAEAGERPLTFYTDPSGTAKLIEAADGSRVSVKTLAEVLRDHPRFAAPKLVKTDLDGFDFEVIGGALDLLKALQPILFFEYAPIEAATGPADGLACFRRLIGIGYDRFLLWDGFGHYLVHLTALELDFHKLVDLTFFLIANRRFGPAVYHYDIAAFPAGEHDLFDAVRQQQLDLCLS